MACVSAGTVAIMNNAWCILMSPKDFHSQWVRDESGFAKWTGRTSRPHNAIQHAQIKTAG